MTRDERIEAALATAGKATDGPWRVDDDVMDEFLGLYDAESNLIAGLEDVDKDYDEARMNFALLQAAPDLRDEVIALRAQRQWISVKERLPPMGVCFDVWDSFHNKRLADHGAYTGSWDDDFRRETLLIHGFTHWMLLPEPPAIEGEGHE